MLLVKSLSRVAPKRLARAARSRSYSDQPWSKDAQAAKNRAAIGPFGWQAGAIFIATGGGLWYYFTSEKARQLERRQQELETASYGKAKIGGPFSLVTHKGQPFTERNLIGKWSLVYFGFTNCPDICPEELDKMGEVVDSLDTEFGPVVQPVFISCDPARDTIEQTNAYVNDFHPRLVGLTGTYDAVKATCKAYRVYFSTPPDTKPGDDYLVDHSIFFYLMDPAGQFVDAYGKSQTAETVRDKVASAIQKWKAAGNAP